MLPVLIILLSYLIGALPTAYIAGRWTRGVDIRHVGDENAGAANAFRELSPAVGVTVGVIDAAKGSLVILIAQAASLHQVAVLACGIAAVAGHNFPIYTGFRGGRGLSTTIGIYLVLVTGPLLIVALPTLLVLILKRDVSLASAFMVIALLLVSWWQNVPGLLIWYEILLPVMVGITHFFRVRYRVARPA